MSEIKKPIKRRVPADKREASAKIKKPPIGRGPVFWMIWLAAVIVVTVVWGFVLTRVNSMLADYEKSQPKYAAARVFKTYFKNPDYNYLVTHTKGIEISPAETIESAVQYARETFGESGAGWKVIKTVSNDPDTIKYSVSDGEKTIGSFTLVKDPNAAEGNAENTYTLGEIALNIHPRRGANIYAPAGSTISVNGFTLGDEYKYGDPVVLGEAVYFPEDAAARTMQNYFIDGLFLEPTVTVTSADGSVTYKLDYNAENVVWRADTDYINRYVKAYNDKIEEEQRRLEEEARAEAERLRLEGEEIRTKIGDLAVQTVKVFARYMQADCTKAERNKYFDKTSAFYKSIDLLMSQSYIMDHAGYHFDDVVDDNYRYVNDEHTAVSAHVKFTQVLTDCTDKYGDKSPEWRNEIDVTVYLHIVNGEWLTYDIRND